MLNIFYKTTSAEHFTLLCRCWTSSIKPLALNILPYSAGAEPLSKGHESRYLCSPQQEGNKLNRFFHPFCRLKCFLCFPKLFLIIITQNLLVRHYNIFSPRPVTGADMNALLLRKLLVKIYTWKYKASLRDCVIAIVILTVGSTSVESRRQFNTRKQSGFIFLEKEAT